MPSNTVYPVPAKNGSPVPAGQSFTVAYPSEKVQSDFVAAGAQLYTDGGNKYAATVQLTQSGIVVQNPTSRTLYPGEALLIDLVLNQKQSPYVLAQTAVPTILPSSGSSNATGVITMTTALPYSLASGQPCAIYLPAGVVTAGSQGSGAGVYQATGLGTNNTVQISGAGIVTANGAYTQVTTEVTLASVTVPGGAIGPNGSLRIMRDVSLTAPSNANAKAQNVKLGGQYIHQADPNAATYAQYLSVMMNRGVQNIQKVTRYNTSTGNVSTTNSAVEWAAAVDTSVAQTLAINAMIVVATDYIILEGYTVEVLPAQ